MSKHRNISNTALAAAMRDLRQSSAASPHKNKARYDRNVAKRNWKADNGIR